MINRFRANKLGDRMKVKRSFGVALTLVALLIAMGTLLSGIPAASAQTNTPATGAPTISGYLRVDSTLTAHTRAIEDADGLSGETFSYQWISNDGTTDSDLQDATSSTYTLASEDEGKIIKVRVSFTDDVGNTESLTSLGTALVSAAYAPTVSLRGSQAHPNTATHDSVVLNWSIGVGSNSQYIERYEIRRWNLDEQESGFAVIDEMTEEYSVTPIRTYTDMSVEPDTRYYYQVRAINLNGRTQAHGGYGVNQVIKTLADPNEETEQELNEEDAAVWIGIDITSAIIKEGDTGEVTLAVTGLEDQSGQSYYNFKLDFVDRMEEESTTPTMTVTVNGDDSHPCEGSRNGSGVVLRDVDSDYTYTRSFVISHYCPEGLYSLNVKWYKKDLGEIGGEFEYGGTFTKDFEVIPSNPPTSYEQVDYITPLHPDPSGFVRLSFCNCVRRVAFAVAGERWHLGRRHVSRLPSLYDRVCCECSIC